MAILCVCMEDVYKRQAYLMRGPNILITRDGWMHLRNVAWIWIFTHKESAHLMKYFHGIDVYKRQLLTVIRKALVNIRKYHEKQRQYSWFDSEESGIILGQKVTALEKVGVYVPGGKAVYPSSVLMNIVPAKVAGVKTIVMTTPPDVYKRQVRYLIRQDRRSRLRFLRTE